MSRRRVLVTGASGFVGRHTLQPLRERGFDVHALGRHDRPADIDGVEWHRGDLLADDGPRIMAAVRPDHLLHLAWTVEPSRFWTDPANLQWVCTTLSLYRAFHACGGRRIVIAGTCAEYDWQDVSGPLQEDISPCRPATLYGAAKHGLHNMLARAAAIDGLSLGWARLFFMYGPHEASARLVPYVALSLLAGKQAKCGDGRAERDFMAIQDVGAALAALTSSSHDGPVNIASGACRPTAEVIRLIAELIGNPELVFLGSQPPRNEPARLPADTRLLNEVVGFRPKFDLETGLAAAVDWWRQTENPFQERHSAATDR